jgi:hypothetical protein
MELSGAAACSRAAVLTTSPAAVLSPSEEARRAVDAFVERVEKGMDVLRIEALALAP